MAPFDLSTLGGAVGSALIFGGFGFAFGFVMEQAGFGDTRKLAGQFYLTEMTVVKVMFTAIVVSALLVAGAANLGLLDMSRVFVNPTFLWPGIVGGLIMGVGFVVGGFCPGTSLVAAATLKIDGVVFVLGALVGVWLFGETVGGFEPFWLSSAMGRFTVPDWLGISTGAAVVLLVAVALLMFWGGEWVERWSASRKPGTEPAVPAAPSRVRAARLAGAGVLVAVAALLAVRGDPTADQRWRWTPASTKKLLADRAVLVHPAEVVALKKDLNVRVQLLDLRSEREFNLFHVGEARRLDAADLEKPEELKALLDRPATTVTFLMGTGDNRALAAWQRLVARGVGNLYVVDGGANRWLELYPAPACVAERDMAKVAAAGAEAPEWRFVYATGERLPSAWPELPASQQFRFPCRSPEPAAGEHAGAGHHGYTWPEYAFTKRVKLQQKAVVKGGCG